LYFKIINSCEKSVDVNYNNDGIGINNIRKRLGLLYPGKYELQNGMEEDVYIVSLTIELHAQADERELPDENIIIPNYA
jgi:LytS/YehU family sensor histidine kinase